MALCICAKGLINTGESNNFYFGIFMCIGPLSARAKVPGHSTGADPGGGAIAPPNSQARIQGGQEGLAPPGGQEGLAPPPLQNPGSAYAAPGEDPGFFKRGGGPS